LSEVEAVKSTRVATGLTAPRATVAPKASEASTPTTAVM
jgi:hypothetical protein